MSSCRKIIIDTDCGVDDADAIMIAFTKDEIEVLGIITVSDNAEIGIVNKNVLKLQS